jgi:hypothetical protein
MASPLRAPRPGGASRRGVAASALLLLLTATATTTKAFLLPTPSQRVGINTRAAATRSSPLSLLHGRRRGLRPTVALAAAGAAAGEVDAEALDAWTAQWKKDNTKVRARVCMSKSVECVDSDVLIPRLVDRCVRLYHAHSISSLCRIRSIDRSSPTFTPTARAQEGQPVPEATVYPHVALAEVLAEVFTQVLEAEEQKGDKKGQQRLLLFPQAKGLYDAGMMERLADHLDLCKEVGGGPGVRGMIASHRIASHRIASIRTSNRIEPIQPEWR